jgi:hypothetical protein
MAMLPLFCILFVLLLLCWNLSYHWLRELGDFNIMVLMATPMALICLAKLLEQRCGHVILLHAWGTLDLGPSLTAHPLTVIPTSGYVSHFCIKNMGNQLQMGTTSWVLGFWPCLFMHEMHY